MWNDDGSQFSILLNLKTPPTDADRLSKILPLHSIPPSRQLYRGYKDRPLLSVRSLLCGSKPQFWSLAAPAKCKSETINLSRSPFHVSRTGKVTAIFTERHYFGTRRFCFLVWKNHGKLLSGLDAEFVRGLSSSLGSVNICIRRRPRPAGRPKKPLFSRLAQRQRQWVTIDDVRD